MKSGGGPRKGASFERLICRQLSLWVSRGRRDDLYWRQPMSGGRATLKHRKGELAEAQFGDVSCRDPAGAELTDQVVIECKHVRDLQLLNAIFYGTGPCANYWRKLCIEAGRVGRHPMMVARQNRMPTLLFINDAGANQLAIDHDGDPWFAVVDFAGAGHTVFVYGFDDVVRI